MEVGIQEQMAGYKRSQPHASNRLKLQIIMQVQEKGNMATIL